VQNPGSIRTSNTAHGGQPCLVDISVNGKNVNLAMVIAGLAEVYRGKSPRGVDLELYRKAEGEAREAKRVCGRVGEVYKPQGLAKNA